MSENTAFGEGAMRHGIGDRCCVIGKDSDTGKYNDCFVFGDGLTVDADNGVLIGETLFDKPIPVNVALDMQSHPDSFRWVVETVVRHITDWAQSLPAAAMILAQNHKERSGQDPSFSPFTLGADDIPAEFRCPKCGAGNQPLPYGPVCVCED
jgi:hypothetical protein